MLQDGVVSNIILVVSLQNLFAYSCKGFVLLLCVYSKQVSQFTWIFLHFVAFQNSVKEKETGSRPTFFSGK